MATSQTEKKLLQWVDQNRESILEEFKKFLRVPSLTGEEGPGQELVAEKLRSFGVEPRLWEPDVQKLFDQYPRIAQYPTSWQPELDLALRFPDHCTWEQLQNSGLADRLSYRGRPNVVGTLPGTGGGRSLLLNGHVDVVTTGDEAKWSHSPFGAEEVDGRIYGRGASDMKGGLWACITAMEAFARCGVQLRGDLMLQSVVNEEHAGNGSLACVAEGYRADAAICAEPTGAGRYASATGGGVYWEIQVTGREAHTGGRWKNGEMNGVSAIEKAAPLITALGEQEKQANREQTLLSLGVGVISGGTYATTTAGECTVSGVVYFAPAFGTGEAGIQAVKDLLRRAVDDCCGEDPWLAAHRPVLSFLHYDDAYVYPEESGFLSALQDAAQRIGGKRLEPLGFSACDARHLGNRGGIPTIVYGPGEIGVAHSVDESIDAEELIQAVKVMIALVYDWCS